MRKTAPQERSNGRTRACLPIDTPAPGPCSAAFPVPIPTKQGSLTGSVPLTLPFTAFIQYTAHYSHKQCCLSTGNDANFSLSGGRGRRPTRACLAGRCRYTIGPTRFVIAVQISTMHKNLYAAVQQELLKFVVLLHWRGSAQNLPLGEGGPPRQRWWMRAVSFILSIMLNSTALFPHPSALRAATFPQGKVISAVCIGTININLSIFSC